ncbi:MAG: hypothetical protein E7644_04395 [Ruminococcaceae bacterium]|nr:hypothetical protein [Oscillospiraceae bacterium]
MRITVCVRQGLDGEINPFDAAAYEVALRIPDAEVTLLSMGPLGARELLLRLTRLGARRAVLLSDAVFAGADTLATAYTLSVALKKIPTDLLLCGRQTLVGDTGQTGPMLSVLAGLSPVTEVMEILSCTSEAVCCRTRTEQARSAPLPALLTVERVANLRLPSIRSRVGEVEVWTAADIGADPARCGLAGSPTRVVETKENQGGRRRCRFIPLTALPEAIAEGLARRQQPLSELLPADSTLRVLAVGEAPLPYARSVSADARVLPLSCEETLAEEIQGADVDAVLFGSDPQSKLLAARVAARLGLGLCADCTALAAEDGELLMIRPALAGSLMAKIKSRTRPALATVRTAGEREGALLVTAGLGARQALDTVRALAERFSGTLAATRRMVDEGVLPYELQVGLTGRTVAPAVYLAVGVSGAVHHIVGMQRSGTVIAVNPDPKAPIFNYADVGVVATAEELSALLP